MSLKQAPFRRVLHRPLLFMGGERELTLSSAVIIGGLVVASFNWVTTIVGACLWLGLIPVFRVMAKADPLMSKVYQRQTRFRGYYAARSRPEAGHQVGSVQQTMMVVGAVCMFLLLVFYLA